jgi:FixJ family two-component response regulator
VLVLDLNMPGDERPRPAAILKEQGVLLPVIFLPGGATSPRRCRRCKEGAIDFIEKPFDYKRVIALVARHLAATAGARGRDRERRQVCERWRSSPSASARSWISWSPAS